ILAIDEAPGPTSLANNYSLITARRDWGLDVRRGMRHYLTGQSRWRPCGVVMSAAQRFWLEGTGTPTTRWRRKRNKNARDNMQGFPQHKLTRRERRIVLTVFILTTLVLAVWIGVIVYMLPDPSHGTFLVGH
ncbi:MAG TPA: hypothetical protein VKU87_06750, partial [Thermomicrobiaceae bacterium]|nr:hypothetical protein [Thermomicrobiaceae bacterium]